MKRNGVSDQSELKSILSYDPETGHFFWRVQKGPSRAGDRAGSPHTQGYWEIRVNGKAYLAHRLAWFYVHGEWPRQIDHENLNRRDNRLLNLRIATNAQNIHNKNAMANNTLGVKGVYKIRNRNRYRSSIQKDGIYTYIGCFRTISEAHSAYCEVGKEIYGDYFNSGAL